MRECSIGVGAGEPVGPECNKLVGGKNALEKYTKKSER